MLGMLSCSDNRFGRLGKRALELTARRRTLPACTTAFAPSRRQLSANAAIAPRASRRKTKKTRWRGGSDLSFGAFSGRPIGGSWGAIPLALRANLSHCLSGGCDRHHTLPL